MTDTRRLTYSGTPINPDMGEGRYQDALRRLRKRIAGGLPLITDDSDVTGDKHTSATWGLCSDDKEQWPDADDHIWPDQFLDEIWMRIAPRTLSEGQRCHMDQRPNPGPYGCFYKCRIFSDRRGLPSREEALERLDKLIDERETKFGKKTTADDNEPWRQP